MREGGRLDGPHIPTRGVAAIRRCGAKFSSDRQAEPREPAGTLEHHHVGRAGPVTVSTMIAWAWSVPSAPRWYTASASCPFACVWTDTRTPGSSSRLAATNRTTGSRPANQLSSGGSISSTASARSSSARARDVGHVDRGRRSVRRVRGARPRWVQPAGRRAGPTRPGRPGPRRSSLGTAVGLMSSKSATSDADHVCTRRWISTARERADRYCNAATKASRIPARDVATAAGSSGKAPSRTSGYGSSQARSVPATSGTSGARNIQTGQQRPPRGARSRSGRR